VAACKSIACNMCITSALAFCIIEYDQILALDERVVYFGVEPDLLILTIDKLIQPPVFLNLRASVNTGAFFVFIRVGNSVNERIMV